jgi:hypothetical protein
MHPFLIALALLAFSLGSSLHATVGIYFGPENQTTKKGWEKGSYAKDFRLSGKVYFLVEFEPDTKRSVEIRLHGKHYRVRAERQLWEQSFSYTQNTHGTVLSDAGRLSETGGPVYHVSWQGRKSWNRGTPMVDPKTGLSYRTPTSLTGHQDLHFMQVIDQDFRQVSTRRTASVTVHVPATKASNDAGDTFEQALQRLKTRLEAAGFTASQTDMDFLD